MFEEIENETFAEREKRILHFWREHSIFQKSLQQRQGAPYYVFYDGPPFATGLPHYGHLLAGTIKDVVPRYQTMRGYYVPRRFGWDCHGLPIENEVEKLHHLTGAHAIQSFGIANFNEACRSIVLRYTEEWQHTVERMGRWVDFSQTWKTMDPNFMESVWWVFSQLYQQGLVYQGFKVMPFSAKLGTPLSNFEASENYKDVDDPSLFVSFALKEDERYLLIWTTTPWTLVSNLAIIVNERVEYATVEELVSGKRYILAEAALPRLFKEEEIKIIERCLGSDLVGKKYEPLFPYFAERSQAGAFRIIADDFVTTDEGTGLVHAAPAFGESDFYAAKKAGIDLVCPVDQNGCFTAEIPEYQGSFVKEADKAIIRRLKAQGNLFKQATIHHRYPFCWRSDTPLIYKAVETWFVAVEKIKEKMLKANEEIHWTPENLKEGRFGKWLEGARDWAISRNRYWGTPIPLWKSEEGEIHVISSCAELEELTGKKVTDLHRHYIDDFTFTLRGKKFKRIPEVFDCWFDAGSMPYAQNHYPFENREMTEKNFPADFIAEGIDQTRGWFYTLTILAAALFDRPAFKNVVVNGIILAEDGTKMSKRLKNYPDPKHVIEKFGADALRLYMLNSPAVKAEDLSFSERGVEAILRQALIPFWNAHAFFTTYARIYAWQPSTHKAALPHAVIDRWILSQLHRLIQEVEQGMEAYDLSRAVEPLVGFIDQLTNWYIRRSRRRFWSEEESPDRREAFETLHRVLVSLSQVAAPFIPFLSEAIYRNLRAKDSPESVHLCSFPHYTAEWRDQILEAGMEALQTVVSLGHALRKQEKIKVRQPLSAMHLVCEDAQVLQFLRAQMHLIAEELNVKVVHFYQEQQDFVKHSIKPNFRLLGKKVGAHMREAQLLISQFSEEQIAHLVAGKSLPMILGGAEFTLAPEDVEISHTINEGWIAMHAGRMTIALETTLTEELILEGIAREIVNKVNMMRKQANLQVSDRIILYLGATEKIKKAMHLHGEYVAQEVLATALHFEQHPEGTSWDINGEPASIHITLAT